MNLISLLEVRNDVYDTPVFHGYQRESVDHQNVFASGSAHQRNNRIMDLCKTELGQASWYEFKEISIVSQRRSDDTITKSASLFDLLMQHTLSGSK